ncbi:EI24 domain-containing protein [Microbacterium sp. NPDC076911]|uniref:EI24 domain-containing protein n=1 Tax=Microbacterium sp. NPDC076911 TaxID=3154958 RepID=UPI0034349ADB
MREFIRGAGLLFRGFAHWRRRPGAMALGLIPAAIVAVLFVAGLVALGVSLPGLTSMLTPFADGWSPIWAMVIRVTVGTAMFGAALAIGAVSFTALTLLIGEPFYDRIWRSVEAAEGTGRLEADYGFWRAARDSLSLIARGILVALITVLIGLIPAVGSILGGIVGVTLTGWLLTDELTSRALTARGLIGTERSALRRGRRARVLGFGVATQLCFLVPLGAVATMPAAVAGSTLLARSLLDEAVEAS